jgi:hypothetical protein
MKSMLSLRSRRATALVALLSGVTACGGGGGGGDAPPPPVEAGTAFVVTTDFQSGSFATLPLDDPGAAQVNRGSINSDAVARFFGGRV